MDLVALVAVGRCWSLPWSPPTHCTRPMARQLKRIEQRAKSAAMKAWFRIYTEKKGVREE